jgi:hypothetical protein
MQKTSYIPPNKRPNTSLLLTKKREPKKEFSLNDSAFPSLNSSATSSTLKPLLSFANATKKVVNKASETVINEVKPGWVLIRKNNGKTEYKYGKATNRYPCSDDNFENRLSRVILNNRLAKEQYEIDNDIIRLGDLSTYYGGKTIYEMFEVEERLLYASESDNDTSSETEYESYFDTYENNKFEMNTQ